jgi:hypothetical protein
MASWKQCQFNERLLDLFMENLGDFRERYYYARVSMLK